MRLAAVFVVGALLGLAQAPALDEAARLKLLRGYERRGEWFLAAEQLEALRKLAPKNPEYAYQLGAVYRSMSKWAFEIMRQQAPHSARVQQMMGEQYSIAGDSNKAIAAFEQAVAADPKLPGSHLALAVLYMRMDKKDQAQAEIEKELVIAPDSAMAKQIKQALAGGGQ